MITDILTFITCGSIDNGKSTLLGRMLYDKKVIKDDQQNDLLIATKKYSNKKGSIDYSLLLDGLLAEREQKITIDVSYKYFRTKKRKFIICDTPGHEQYTKNMVTGASKADLAIILIDIKKGILNQTIRHLFICSFLNIKNIIVAINKIDAVKFNYEKYQNIVLKFKKISSELNFNNIYYLPISALLGDNIIKKSKNTPWYKGVSLLSILENIKIENKEDKNKFIMPVQLVQTDKKNKRRYLGTVISGSISKNQDIYVLPSKQKNIIKNILFYKKNYNKINQGKTISLELKKEIDVSRGDIITSKHDVCFISDQFSSNLIWLDSGDGYLGRSYFLKIGHITIGAQITKIELLNIEKKELLEKKKLKINDLAKVNIRLEKEIPFTTFANNKTLGSFVLIDRINLNTIASGMIKDANFASQNTFSSYGAIARKDRNFMNGHKSKVIWFTGLSGAGKSTLAIELEKKLFKEGIRSYVLDGDNLRQGINKDLDFSEVSRIENMRRTAEISKIFSDAGIVVITALISPYRVDRDTARSLFKKEDFLEVFIKVSLETVKKRDVKNLYKKAKQGKIKMFTGIDSRYEEPLNPDVIIDTDKLSINKSVSLLYKKVLNFLK